MIIDDKISKKENTMQNLEHIREKISLCDDKIIKALAERMNYIEEIIEFKKEAGIPILQPEQEERQYQTLRRKLEEHKYEDEILNIFKYIVRNSRKIQAKSLFSRNIMLIGFMGAGKSTVSRYLSKMLAMEEIEMDDLIVEKEGMSINEIFAVYGETYFRNCESNVLIELQAKEQAIVSCGGGVVLRDENVTMMKRNGRIVLLTASPETTLDRVKDSDERPILRNNMNVEFILELMNKRKLKYEAAADIIIATDGKDVQAVCEELIKQLVLLEH